MTKEEIEEAWQQAYSFSENETAGLERVGEKVRGSRIYILWKDRKGKYLYTVDRMVNGKRMSEEQAVFGKKIKVRKKETVLESMKKYMEKE